MIQTLTLWLQAMNYQKESLGGHYYNGIARQKWVSIIFDHLLWARLYSRNFTYIVLLNSLNNGMGINNVI